MKPWKFVPVVSDPADLQFAIHADIMTRSLDVAGRPYKRTVEYEGRTMYVMRLGQRKTVIVTGGSSCLLCVPAEREHLSRGFKTRAKDLAGNPTPFSADARNVIMNGPPQADYLIAKRAGAGLIEYDPIVAQDIYGLRPGLYDSIKHPGDTSWHSADGLTVISWWSGGRYATSAQLWYGVTGPTSGLATWTDLDALADGGSQSAVLDGTLPGAVSEITGATAIDTYAQDRVYNVTAVNYGVWKNGTLWYKSKPGIAHMHRKRTIDDKLVNELVSVVGYVASGNGVVRLWMRFTPDGGIQVEYPLLLARLDTAKGETLNSLGAPGSWHGGEWYENALVIMEEAPVLMDYQCYAMFNPAGTKLLVYGVTSGPVMLDPALMDNHTAADYRIGQVFECDVPADASAPAQMTHSVAQPPSWETQTYSQAGAPSFTPSDTGSEAISSEYVGATWAYFTITTGYAFWYAFKQTRFFGEQSPSSWVTDSETSTPKKTWNRTTDELVPFVDWGPDGVTPVAPRKVFTSHREFESENWTKHRTIQAASTRLSAGIATNGSGGSGYNDFNYEYRYHSNNTGLWADGWYFLETGITDQTVVTKTTINYLADGTSTTTTTTNTITPGVIKPKADVRDWFVTQTNFDDWSAHTDVGLGGASDYVCLREYTETLRLYEGGPIADSFYRSGSFPKVFSAYETVAQLVSDTPATAAPGASSYTASTGVRCNLTGSPPFAYMQYAYHETITHTRTKFLVDDIGTVSCAVTLPNGIVTGGTIPDTEFFNAEYHNGIETEDSVEIDSVDTFALTVTPTWTDIKFCDPRWPVWHIQSELLWERYDSDENLYNPGSNSGDVLKEVILDDPSDKPLDETLPLTAPGCTYATVTPPTTAGTGRSQAKFVASGPFTSWGFPLYIPTSDSAHTTQYLSGWRAALWPSGEERIYHYDISPDVELVDKRMFGLPAWQAAWPAIWGSDTDRKPAMWLANGDKKPLAIEEVYGAGVIYTSPMFVRRFKK